MSKITGSSGAAQRRQSETVNRAATQESSPNDAIVSHLQRQVANALVLYLNYKHYHWQTYGPLFRDLHLMFDEFAKAVLATVDDFAERIRMVGQDPIFDLEEIAKTASIKVAQTDQTMLQMVEEADINLFVVIKEMRLAVRTADELDDPGTVDLFSRHVQIHEKHEWWLRDILETGDGLPRNGFSEQPHLLH